MLFVASFFSISSLRSNSIPQIFSFQFSSAKCCYMGRGCSVSHRTRSGGGLMAGETPFFGASGVEQRLPWWICALIFMFRLFLCVSIMTVEAPDEWWQSTEVAYYMVFGKGHLPWEWHYALRSPLFPGIYAVPFFLLKFLGLDTTWAVWFVPRLVQTIVLTCIDLCVFYIGASVDAVLEKSSEKWRRGEKNKESRIVVPVRAGVTKRLRIGSVAYFSLVLSLSNWYMAFGGVRAYSNVMETLFVLVAARQESYLWFLLMSGVATSIRSTSALTLFPLLLPHLNSEVRKRGVYGGVFHILFSGLALCAAFCSLLVVVDSLFFKRLVFTPLTFFRFNVLHNVSRFFGDQPWYFYFAVVLPCITLLHVFLIASAPLVLWKDVRSRAAKWHVCGIMGFVAWTLAAFSLIHHKEMRFVFPVIPFCFIIAAFVLSRCYHECKVVYRLHYGALFLNIIFIALTGYVYRRGPLDLVAQVRSGPMIDRLDIISTCYTTPGLSYMHRKVNHLGLINCSLAVDNSGRIITFTENIIFQRYPKDFVLWRYDGVHTFNESDPEDVKKAAELQQVVAPRSMPHPDAMIMFRDTANKLKEVFLDKHQYILFRSFLHSPVTFAPNEDIYMEMWVRKAP